MCYVCKETHLHPKHWMLDTNQPRFFPVDLQVEQLLELSEGVPNSIPPYIGAWLPRWIKMDQDGHNLPRYASYAKHMPRIPKCPSNPSARKLVAPGSQSIQHHVHSLAVACEPAMVSFVQGFCRLTDDPWEYGW